MPIHMIDSEIYGNAWSTDEMHNIFDDRGRTRAWLHIIACLAEAQAEVGLIPADVVPEIKRVCDIDLLNMTALRKGYESTGHSMLGLIRELKKLCHNNAGEWIYYGATVQDIADTWMSQALLEVWQIVFRDLRQIENDLLELSERYRDTPMCGRTHGQPALPITFGFKVATWLREIRRHVERLKDTHKRLGEGQLAGGVGSLSSLGEKGFEVQTILFNKLGLRTPDIAWISSRDVQAEFIHLLAMIAATFDKIGHEVYTLQRAEVNEVREGFVQGTVGSITMPHKRNPEIAEHLGTLARLIRHNAACLFENLVHEHERDGRSWKAEWGLIGPICAMTGSLLRLSKIMCANLVVDPEAMLANLEATQGYILSEKVMLCLAQKIGKQTAHELVYNIAMNASEKKVPLKAAVIENAQIRAYFSLEEIEAMFNYEQNLGLCTQFVDKVSLITRKAQKNDLPFLSLR
ncbi:MAG: adenylosuccinate lyase family protein [Chloroflexi bacterium]|nr:adenylosuccinate lyase family protein [Chloroflexota bacterium]